MHTNTIEGYFSIFKRGMKGVYQHCSKKHLHRYAAEFEFRYSNRIAHGVDDQGRAGSSPQGCEGEATNLQASSLKYIDIGDNLCQSRFVPGVRHIARWGYRPHPASPHCGAGPTAFREPRHPKPVNLSARVSAECGLDQV